MRGAAASRVGACLRGACACFSQPRMQMAEGLGPSVWDARLARYGLRDVPAFCYQGLATRVRVVDVHDGDTVRVVGIMTGAPDASASDASDASDAVFTLSVRLRGIDAAEVNTADPAARQKAFRARDRVVQLVSRDPTVALLTPGIIRERLAASVCLADLRNVGIDKYGRVLADVLVDAPGRPGCLSIADVLLAEGLARRYMA